MEGKSKSSTDGVPRCPIAPDSREVSDSTIGCSAVKRASRNRSISRVKTCEHCSKAERVNLYTRLRGSLGRFPQFGDWESHTKCVHRNQKACVR